MHDKNGDEQESSVATDIATGVNAALDVAEEAGASVPGYVGTAIDVGSQIIAQSSDGDLTTKDVAQASGSLSGAAAGTAMGAGVGTAILPGAGTVVGGVIGGYVGGEAGEGLVNGVSELLGDQTDTVVTQIHSKGTEDELTQTFSKSGEINKDGQRVDVIHVSENSADGQSQWTYSVEDWDKEKARLEAEEATVKDEADQETDPSNHTLGSARSDGSDGYTQAGHEENALDAIAEDAHNLGISQIAPSPKPKEEPPSNDGGKGSTVEPEPAPAPKAKKVKKEKKKDSGKPVVVDLDGDGIETTDLDESEAMFDFDNDGFREKTAWVGADDGLLVFDVGGDGQVTEAKEIAFAYWTEDENDTDLEGLRTVFDSNNDGQLNEQDEDWAGFRIWQDKNQNGISEEGEFLSLEEAGIQSIGLEHKEGTGEVHEDGTVNHGMIDVQMTDGSVNEGGDIAFAYEANGQREVVDAEGNTFIEYESDTFVFAEPDQGFTVTDYDNFVTRIHNMGIAETAVSALEYAQQSGADVVFDFGEETLTLENVSLDQLSVDLQSFADDLLVA